MFKTIHTMVFKESAGGGNPCPVTLDADGLTTEQMQEMTRLSGEECVFLIHPARLDCDLRARYFVPAHEMGMCIHATIGAAAVLASEGRADHAPLLFETDLGPIKVDWERTEDKFQAAVTQFMPEFGRKAPVPEDVCRALGITLAQLEKYPIQCASTSRSKLMVPLVSRSVLDDLKPEFEYMWQLCDACETSGFYPFVLDKTGRETVCFARQFPNRSGYDEDPATGVAASALGAYLVHHRIVPVREGWNSCTVYQGQAMGKPSVIYAETLVESGKITGARVRGEAVLE